ncbi:MAG: Crp/Fnr family transcriptional regulator [Rhodobacteraceae bacterium]|nr:MAG: Crp/Fnr family transcriptional regulator [Paracoccaceae bacterium]
MMSPRDRSSGIASLLVKDVRPPWDGQEDAQLERLLSDRTRALSKGALLVMESEASPARYLVRSGWLAVAKSLPDGERQIVEFILPGESYDPTAADGQTSFVELEALCDSNVAVIDTTTWSRLMKDLPDLRRCESQLAKAAWARQAERMLRLGKSDAETRVAYALIELCMRMTAIGATEDGAFHVPLSQQQLGEFTGLSSVHVCRTLRRLNRQGLITTEDHMDINIHDLYALADLAEVDLTMLRRDIIPGAAA